MPENGSHDGTGPAAAEDPDWLPPELNTGQAHPARVYDYMLGGKDNFAADRALGDAVTRAMPSAPFMARANRAFLGRAVRYLAKEAGIRQFLDIGTGIPAAGNTYEVAQAVAPESRVVYVDNDPIVLAHGRALMTSDPAGATAFIQADLREPDKILADPALYRTLDLGEPVALMLVAILMYIRDEENPRGLVSALLDALPPGSYLTVSHPTADFSPGEAASAVAASERSGISFTPRTQAEVAAFFAGLELVDPGVVPVLAWHPDGGAPADPRAVYYYGAMGRKP
jgi:S-adenosyl methyltransferase